MAEKKGWFTVDGDGDRHINLGKVIPLGITLLVLIIVFTSVFSCVSANERGIRYTFGEAGETVLQPGIHVKAPFVGAIKTWKITPNKLAIDIDINSMGAISKDNQIIGVRLVTYWNRDPDRMYEIATRYDDKSLEQLIASQANSSIKAAIGRYTIFDLAQNQDAIGEAVKSAITTAISPYPMLLTQVNISNFDWSPEFDQQIQATMNAAQQVKQAEQKANIAEQENRRLSIEAEARAKAQIATAEGELRTAELNADAARAKANGERDAKIAQGEGIQKYNQLIAVNLSTEIQLRELEIKLERAKKFNGREVPDVMVMTPQGSLINPAR